MLLKHNKNQILERKLVYYLLKRNDDKSTNVGSVVSPAHFSSIILFSGWFLVATESVSTIITRFNDRLRFDRSWKINHIPFLSRPYSFSSSLLSPSPLTSISSLSLSTFPSTSPLSFPLAVIVNCKPHHSLFHIFLVLNSFIHSLYAFWYSILLGTNFDMMASFIFCWISVKSVYYKMFWVQFFNQWVSTLW